MMEGKHIKLVIKDSVAVVKFNSPDSKVNVLNNEVGAEMKKIIQTIEDDQSILAAVFISGKPGCFIAGGDVTMLEKVETVKDGVQISKDIQETLLIIEESRKPTVAVIQGSCLGGGLEVALACHYRIAVNDPRTKLGLPEVLIGLLPGGGGTQRLPKLVGVTTALDLMLTGRSVRAKKALEMHLIDQLIEPVDPGSASSDERTAEYAERIAIKIARDISSEILNPYRAKSWSLAIMEWVLMFGFAKDKIFAKAQAEVMAKSHGLYPAPLKILEVVRNGLEVAVPSVGYDFEAKGFGNLLISPESQALISLFHGQTESKKNRFGKPDKLPAKLGLVGVGYMGGGIAEISVLKGFRAIVKDSYEPRLKECQENVNLALNVAKNKDRITESEEAELMTKFSYQTNYDGFDTIDMVIESVWEGVNTKHSVIKELEEHIPEHCIIATNTSSLLISKLSEGSKRPEKIIGMRFSAPVQKSQLLEIIPSPQTSKETIATAVEVGLKLGKICIVVKDSPGFYTTRLFGTLISEAFRLFQEGVDPRHMNELMVKFGFPVGICTFFDEVGLDDCYLVAANLHAAFGERFSEDPPHVLEDLVRTTCIGKKSESGKGIFMKDSTKKGGKELTRCDVADMIFTSYEREPVDHLNDRDIVMRMVTRFVNEAVLCLEEKVIASPLDGDVGAVFGLGFPPFTGGPFHYVDSFGALKLVKQMRKFDEVHGVCFNPCQLLLDHASNPTKRFYPLK